MLTNTATIDLDTKLEFLATDRVMVLAPHPDDESIATGGLLQAARIVGAALHVVVLTDGDNNPWPQRWIEKRWRIDPPDRARWGQRRRDEACTAMSMLGIKPEQMSFLGLPDTSLTALLMHARKRPVTVLRDQIQTFAPTHLIMPALSDRHPDHSATHILARLALAQLNFVAPKLYAFAVHGGESAEAQACVNLSPAQRETKRLAILAHASQMRLSKRRFLQYARAHEATWPIPAHTTADPKHCIQATVHDDTLHVQIDRGRMLGNWRGRDLFTVLEADSGDQHRWQIPLNARAKTVPVYDAISAAPTITAAFGGTSRNRKIEIGLPRQFKLKQGWVKIAASRPGLWVLDQRGWQIIAAK